MKSAYQSAFTPNGHILSNRISSDELKYKNKIITEKYEQKKYDLQSELNRNFYNSFPRPEDRQNANQRYKEELQQCNYDIAWQVFDEVNERNDALQIIDLNCLDVDDARAIAK